MDPACVQVSSFQGVHVLPVILSAALAIAFVHLVVLALCRMAGRQ